MSADIPFRMSDRLRVCRYCGESRRLTQEHAISAGVIGVLLDQQRTSSKFKNIGYRAGRVSGQLWLLNDEPTIGDLCGECNRKSSSFDAAGVELVRYIVATNDPRTPLIFTSDSLGWIVKTHLNLLHGTPQNEDIRLTTLDMRVRESMRRGQPVPSQTYRLYAEGIDVPKEVWDSTYVGMPRYWAQVTGLYDGTAKIMMSMLSIGWLNTLFFIPAEASYDGIDAAADYIVRELNATRDYRFGRMDVDAAVRAGSIILTDNVANLPTIRSRLRIGIPAKPFRIALNRVHAVPGCKLQMEFADGTAGLVNISILVDWGLFPEFADPEFFSQVSVDSHTQALCWPRGIQIAADPFHQELSRSTD